MHEGAAHGSDSIAYTAFLAAALDKKPYMQDDRQVCSPGPSREWWLEDLNAEVWDHAFGGCAWQ